jgi:hypothetical protein
VTEAPTATVTDAGCVENTGKVAGVPAAATVIVYGSDGDV